MSAPQHTPGPWVVQTHHEQGHSRLVPIWYVSAENGVGVARQPSFSDPSHERGNALLIAAAPDMLAALEVVYHEGGSYQEWKHQVRAAIRKAKGEDQ